MARRKKGRTIGQALMSRCGGAFLLVIALFAESVPAPAPAESSLLMGGAGSAGGSIAKHEKSASGTDGPPHPVLRRKKAAPIKPGVKPSTCGAVVGEWGWFNGGSVTISADGTTAHAGERGSWHCEGRTAVITWNAGWVDRLRLSLDSRTLSGANQFGVPVSGTRN
jgi:hypothetical protein